MSKAWHQKSVILNAFALLVNKSNINLFDQIFLVKKISPADG